MRTFITDPARLKIWSPSFFASLIEGLLVEDQNERNRGPAVYS